MVALLDDPRQLSRHHSGYLARTKLPSTSIRVTGLLVVFWYPVRAWIPCKLANLKAVHLLADLTLPTSTHGILPEITS